MKLFKIRGGIHPSEKKDLSANAAIRPLPMPSLLRIPQQQHIGQGAVAVVRKGDIVKKGQLLASRRGVVSAAIHAPTSGRIIAIGRFQAPHASGLPAQTITMRPDGKDEWGELPPPIDDPLNADPELIAQRVEECGIVGMGGATFPSAVKLKLRNRHKLETLIINGAECEPYLTCDDRLMRERAFEVMDGVRIMRHALGVKRAVIAIESNKPEAYAALKRLVHLHAWPDIAVVQVPTQYPMGSEKHLVQTLTGKETPARALTADIGVVVHNTATCYAVHEAVRHGKPLISRIVTVSGNAIREPANLEVLIGTPVSSLLDHCGVKGSPARLLLGGPMMGQPITNTRIPIVKGANGVLALTENETPRPDAMPCIRCTACVGACPCGLSPLDMAARIRHEELEGAVKIGLLDCIACGSCAWVCPSHIPLVQYFNYAKGKLTAIERAKHKQEETRRLVQFRDDRMEKIKKAKQEAMKRMKAEREAKKKAEAAAKQAAGGGDEQPQPAARKEKEKVDA